MSEDQVTNDEVLQPLMHSLYRGTPRDFAAWRGPLRSSYPTGMRVSMYSPPASVSYMITTSVKQLREPRSVAGIRRGTRKAAHSELRRPFATDLKDEPLADVAALGGWKSTTTLLACYITADPATMKRALARRRTIEDA